MSSRSITTASCIGAHESPRLRIAAYIGGLLGLALLITLVVRADLSAMLHTF